MHRLVRDGVYALLSAERVFQEMQPPAFVPVGRGTAHQGDQVGFSFTVEKTLLSVLLFFAAQAGLHPALGEALADAADGGQTNSDLGGNGGIFVRAAFLCFVGQE